MPGLQPMSLTVMLVSEDVARARAALSLALADAALGGTPRIYAHERAVTMLATATREDDDSSALASEGLPDRPTLLAMAVAEGVTLIACQTGLSSCDLAIEQLMRGTEAGGLVGLLATLGGSHLIVV